MDEFDIYIGGIAEDRAEPPAARLARAFGLAELRAREFVASLPRVVKRSVPEDQAQRYAQVLYELGAVFELRRSPIRPVQTIGVSGVPGRLASDADELDRHGALLPLPDLRSDARAERGPIPPWNPVTAPTLRESRPPPPHSQQTLREAVPAEVFAVRYAAPEAWAPTMPAPVPAPARALVPAPARALVPAPARAPAPPSAAPAPPSAAGFPASSREQPTWLALGADKYSDDLEQLSAPPAEPHGSDRAPPAAAARLPARPPGPRPFSAYSAGRVTQAGVPIGRESRPTPPFLLRLAMRAVLGGSLFLVLTSVRHCHLFPTDLEHALAEWQGGSAAGAAEAAALGPVALDWMVSDLHQVTGGDKDRARGIAERFKAAGAVEVYVGSIMNAGAVKVAGELLVELPPDEDKRKAVLAVHAELLTSTFGGVAVAPPDEHSSVLRIVL